MKFKLFKSRKEKLYDNIKLELESETPNIDTIINLVDNYEYDNIQALNRYSRDRKIDAKKINGALKQSIHAHGPITKELIGSATKRILGAFVVPEQNDTEVEVIPPYWLRTISYAAWTVAIYMVIRLITAVIYSL